MLAATNRSRMNFTPDLRWALPYSLKSPVKVIDLANGKSVELESPATSGTTSFTPDGRWLMLHGNAENFLYATATWKLRTRWPSGGETYGQHCYAFSGDSRRLAMSYANETMKLFSVPEMRELITLTPPRVLDFRDAVFSADGRRLWLIGVGGRVFEWDLGALEGGVGEAGHSLVAVAAERFSETFRRGIARTLGLALVRFASGASAGPENHHSQHHGYTDRCFA